MQGRLNNTAHWNALTLHSLGDSLAYPGGAPHREAAKGTLPWLNQAIPTGLGTTIGVGPDPRRYRFSPSLPLGRARMIEHVSAGRPLNVGVFIPLSGAAGLWGPSCHRCAELAVQEINSMGGVAGRPLVMSVVDAGQAPADVAAAAQTMLNEDRLDAIVGMHISAVRVALAAALRQRIPYIYTPLYEGGETDPGVFSIGETPNQQVKPAIGWFRKNLNAEKWALIGNDYIWPHVTHRAARRYIGELAGRVVDEHFVPLGHEDFSSSILRIAEAGPDAVMVSLVGQDLIQFNRQFVAHGLDRRIKRFCPALDENILLGLLPDAGLHLHTSGAYFGSLESKSNIAFSTKYFRRFSYNAPVLNRFSALCYEGVRLYAGMVSAAGTPSLAALSTIAEGFTFDGPRGRRQLMGNHVTTPIYIARVDDGVLKPIHGLPNQAPGN